MPRHRHIEYRLQRSRSHNYPAAWYLPASFIMSNRSLHPTRGLTPMRAILSVIGLIVLSLAAIATAQAQEATPVTGASASSSFDAEAAAAYCLEHGGEVRHRTPVLGLNLPKDQQITLGGARDFCEFTGGEGADPGTWISISLETLYSEEPTLATLAYLTKPGMPDNTGSANPSAVQCVYLGGAYDFGGVTPGGGGWVTTDPEPAFEVMSYCVFPDGSMIDAWGITYHANDIIRGADLTPILRYQSDSPPHVFPEQ